MAILKTQHSHDHNWARAVQCIWEMLVVFVSVLCCIIPRTQKFWSDLQSGGANIHNTTEIELSSSGRYGKRSNGHSHSTDKPWHRSQDRATQSSKARSSAMLKSRESEDSERELVEALHGDLGKARSRRGTGQDGRGSTVQETHSRSERNSRNTILDTVEFSMHVEQA